jgi:hypothetical protein
MVKGKNWAFAILAVGGGFLGGIAATQLAPAVADAARATRTIRATQFELVDDSGGRRALLEVTPSGISDLLLFDGDGRDRAELRVTRNGIAKLGFYDSTGAQRVVVGEVPTGVNGIEVYGSNGLLRGTLAVDPDDEARVTLYDPKTGVARVGLGVAQSGAPALALYDGKGNDRAELHVRDSGHPGLALADETGKSIAGLPETEPPQPSAQ